MIQGGDDGHGPHRNEKKNEKMDEKDFTLHCLRKMDPATNWFKIVKIPEKRVDIIANEVEQTWLVRCPWPEKTSFGRGKEFVAGMKQTLCDNCDVNQCFVTARNPQANAMLERTHQTIGNMIRLFRTADTEINEDDHFTGILHAVVFATRATVRTSLGVAPNQLVFGTKFIAD